jgi:hypothetical protein
MAISNAERQKRWREKNRVLYNLQRRNRRKRELNSVTTVTPVVTTEKKDQISELRELMIQASEKQDEPKPQIFRNDYGNIISERQWNALQKKKGDAKEGEYVLDEYSQ